MMTITSGCTFVRSDHQSATKQADVCVKIKNYLPLSVIDIDYLNAWPNFEFKIGKKCKFSLSFIGLTVF